MKLTLRNLGRLREATIDLSKDLILLTGPNNTSKTYVAHAIYGFCSSSLPSLIPVVAHSLQDSSAGQSNAESFLQVDSITFIERHLTRLLEYLSNDYRKRLGDVLAASEDFIKGAEVFLKLIEEMHAESKRVFLATSFNEDVRLGSADVLAVRKASGDGMWTFERVSTQPTTGVSDSHVPGLEGTSWLSYRASTYIVSSIVRVFLRITAYPHILTAERAAIQLFSRELSIKRTEFVDSLLRFTSTIHQRRDAGEALLETLEQRARRYPLAIRDGLRLASDLPAYKKLSSPFAPLAEELERKLLGGAIRVDEDGDMLFHPEGAGRGLDLHLSSSSVKSLAGLSFYLRHIAETGGFLIIDEPELNLHPDNQRRVARVLARLVRSGIKVLITTHSDYIIRELNNLIMLSSDKDGSVRQRLGYSEEEMLTPNQVGAYLFNTECANPIEVTPTGIEVATIDREINALNKDSQDIYFSLFNKTDA